MTEIAAPHSGYGDYALYGHAEKQEKVNYRDHEAPPLRWKKGGKAEAPAPDGAAAPQEEQRNYSFGYGDGYAQVDVQAETEEAPPVTQIHAVPVKRVKVEKGGDGAPSGVVNEEELSNSSFSMGYGDGYAITTVEAEETEAPALMPDSE